MRGSDLFQAFSVSGFFDDDDEDEGSDEGGEEEWSCHHTGVCSVCTLAASGV